MVDDDQMINIGDANDSDPESNNIILVNEDDEDDNSGNDSDDGHKSDKHKKKKKKKKKKDGKKKKKKKKKKSSKSTTKNHEEEEEDTGEIDVLAVSDNWKKAPAPKGNKIVEKCERKCWKTCENRNSAVLGYLGGTFYAVILLLFCLPTIFTNVDQTVLTLAALYSIPALAFIIWLMVKLCYNAPAEGEEISEGGCQCVGLRKILEFFKGLWRRLICFIPRACKYDCSKVMFIMAFCVMPVLLYVGGWFYGEYLEMSNVVSNVNPMSSPTDNTIPSEFEGGLHFLNTTTIALNRGKVFTSNPKANSFDCVVPIVTNPNSTSTGTVDLSVVANTTIYYWAISDTIDCCSIDPIEVERCAMIDGSGEWARVEPVAQDIQDSLQVAKEIALKDGDLKDGTGSMYVSWTPDFIDSRDSKKTVGQALIFSSVGAWPLWGLLIAVVYTLAKSYCN